MPMGMHTVVSQGGGTLSGGQRQRLLIARALAARPRIFFFDEATSALDNATQAAVSESLDELRVTRVVIAHRLSTIRHADKIVVLDRGRIVQVGRFDELMQAGRAFSRPRQTTDGVRTAPRSSPLTLMCLLNSSSRRLTSFNALSLA